MAKEKEKENVKKSDKYYLEAVPNAEFLIKSIAEQGYTLESAIADLADNSISANCNNIEILVSAEKEPFQVFIGDDGDGMTQEELYSNCRFPSSSPDDARAPLDLGRFGLGMKTASFSQTRKFTILSRQSGAETYKALTWDVDFITETGNWNLIINTEQEIDELLSSYQELSASLNNPLSKFTPNTIIIWFGLYKFESTLNESNRSKALKREMAETVSDHLGIVFHRFIQRSKNKLKIRVNNSLVPPFNPFPEDHKGFRSIEYKQKKFGSDNVRLEGFVLPSIALDEVKTENNIWSTPHKSLIDMEGVYIYRADRLILYGGWNGLIKKFPRLQLARLRVDIGNGVDHLLHLNVAKSAVIIPHDLKEAFEGYIRELTTEATKEYHNRGLRKFPERKKTTELTLFNKIHTNKGPKVELNGDYPLVQSLRESLDTEQEAKFNILLRVLINSVNTIRDSESRPVNYEIVNKVDIDIIANFILTAKELGYENEFIKDHVSANFGLDYSDLPKQITLLME
ncbi:ATP-binding protein [Glaciecola sp. XM2]|uniref:ATP-binding protein n=1 Tax=Glaciecola sp. XM2 TaxID=1914931 RepID=UPI001BDF1BB8|nr:ATP-binding protein [Glaciecola sp. XM2]MBT1451513.1 ATP-binding protein [Glaciecola sp. XM2]